MSESRGEDNPEIVRCLLALIERDSRVTQRRVAGELRIALGMANAYLRRCVRKGLIKVNQVPLNRYAYYLTPQGFAEKSRLTAEYLVVSFNFFRLARADCTDLLVACANDGWKRAALYGAGELAEIAVLSAGETGVELVCVVDAAEVGRRCGGLAVVADLPAALALAGTRSLDGLILTDTRTPQLSFDRLMETMAAHGFAPDRIVASKLLGIANRLST